MIRRRNTRALVEALEHRQLLAADYVIHISVDGLRPDAVTQLGAAQLPNFYRLRTQGTITDNARTDYDNTVTLTNHTGMVTGRPLNGAAGHTWTSDVDEPANLTLHSKKGSYIASVWDVTHDNGRRTGIFASKSKFVLYSNTYDAETTALQGGAPDVTGADNGRDKIDVAVFNADESVMTNSFVSSMNSQPMHYSLIHFSAPDHQGHAYGWMTSQYLNAVKTVDSQLAKIFAMIDGNAALAGKTAIILTADHGGAGTAHHNATERLDYTIPFYVWGSGVTAGGDLYAMNPQSRLDPAAGRPNHSASVQPVRNLDVANLALDLLNLPSVPGSEFNFSQNLITSGAATTNKPAAPSNLAATSLSATQIRIAWTDNSNNETQFKIERSTDGVNFAPLAGSGANFAAYTNSGLATGKRYWYRVAAVNASGWSAWSNIANAVTGTTQPPPPPPPTAPAAPTGLTASAASTTAINLAWADKATNETGYRVEKSTDGVSFTLFSNFGVNKTSTQVTGLAANTKYYFRVQALGSSGNSAWSNIANATTQGVTQPPPGPLAAPTNLALAVSTSVANAINLSWSDNATGESGYKIERSTDGNTFYAVAGGGANATFHRDTNLTKGRRYWYRVYAVNSSGAKSGYSNVASLVA